jgi:small-conductance mechanosensitive channel
MEWIPDFLKAKEWRDDMRAINALCVTAGLILSIIVASVSLAQAAPQTTPSEEPATQVSPVRIDDMVLFHVRGIKAFPAKDRAEAIEERIKKIASDRAVKTDSITSVESEISTDIVADGRPIMSIFDVDAALDGVSRQVLAKAYIAKLRTSIEKYRKDRSKESLVKNALFALLATVIFIVSLKLLLWLLRKLNALVEARYKAKIHALHIQSLEFIHAERIWATLTGTVKVIRLVLTFVLLYFYLDVVLSLFPWTRLLAANLLDYALVPLRTMWNGLLKYIPNLIFIIIFVIIVRYVLKLTHLFFSAIESETIKFAGFDKDWAKPTYKAVRLLLIVFAAVVMYPHIPGSESPAFKGISIFLGVLFSLGSSSAISNIIAGYTMTYRRAFKVGERIKVDDITGDVTEIRLLVTHLRTIKNEEIIIPNSKILNSEIVNYNTYARERGLILHTTVGIGYEVPWRQVEAMLMLAAERTPGILKDPKPFVLQKSLGDFAVTYELNVYIDDPHNMAQIYSDLHKNILDAFNEYGVQIMTPAYEGDPDQLKVVPKDQWFAAPAQPPQNKEQT